MPFANSNSNKKVLFVDHDSARSGATISMEYIIKAFNDSNFDIYILTRKSENDLKIISKLGVNVLPYSKSPWKSIALSIHFSDDFKFLSLNWFKTNFKNLLRIFVSFFTIWICVRKIKPDYIYLNEHNLIMGSVVGHLLKIPTFMHVRSKFISGKFHIREFLIANIILKFNDYVFPISKIEFNQVLKYQGNKRQNIEIIPEFLSDENFEILDVKEIREELLLPLDKKIILSFGGIDKLKGSLDYLKCIDILNKNVNNLFFILAGDTKSAGFIKDVSEYYQQTNELLQKISKYSNFKIIGFVENTKKLLNSIDVLLSPLTSSHFSRPIIEAWALKKPIITSDTEHSRSYIKDAETGLFYKPGDVEQLSKLIIKLTSDNILYDRLRFNGYELAKNYYLVESNPLKIMNKFYECSDYAFNNNR